jgi:hypothetical protein
MLFLSIFRYLSDFDVLWDNKKRAAFLERTTRILIFFQLSGGC